MTKTLLSGRRDKQRGFTIVELMIATTVLSLILLLVSVVMIGVGNLFSKGVNQAKVQNSVRNIADDLSQQLKYSSGIVAGNPTAMPTQTEAFCIGTTRYSYIKTYEIGS